MTLILATPAQPWLDGINTGKDIVRQFVAMPLGKGVTVEAQITDNEVVGGLQLEAIPIVCIFAFFDELTVSRT